MTWMLFAGFVLSHMLDSLFYHWEEVVRRPWSLLMPWEGLSSFGGFVGALIGIVLWRKHFVIVVGRKTLRSPPAAADLAVCGLDPLRVPRGVDLRACWLLHRARSPRCTNDRRDRAGRGLPATPRGGDGDPRGLHRVHSGARLPLRFGLPRAPLHDSPRRVLCPHVEASAAGPAHM